jgi:hypothetical protein
MDLALGNYTREVHGKYGRKGNNEGAVRAGGRAGLLEWVLFAVVLASARHAFAEAALFHEFTFERL